MKNLYAKLLLVQKELGAIKKEADNPFFHSKYFDINALAEHVKPLLSTHGLVLIQPLGFLDNGRATLRTILIDAESGEELDTETPLPDNIDPQKMGSAITYFRRYAIQSLLFMQADEDDDGNAASQPAAPKPQYKAGEVQKVLKMNDVMPFGKHKGKKVSELPKDYIDWMNTNDGSTRIEVVPAKEPDLDPLPF